MYSRYDTSEKNTKLEREQLKNVQVPRCSYSQKCFDDRTEDFDGILKQRTGTFTYPICFSYYIGVPKEPRKLRLVDFLFFFLIG